MTDEDAAELIRRLAGFEAEQEWLEFKATDVDCDKIGEYVSALANGAMLHNERRAYLIFGVRDGDHEIVGTRIGLENKKHGGNLLANHLGVLLKPKIHFKFHTTTIDGKRIEFIEIEPSYQQPVKFKNIAYIRNHSVLKKLDDFPQKEQQLWLLTMKNSFEDGLCESSLDPAGLGENFYIRELTDNLYGQQISHEVLLSHLVKDGFLLDNKNGKYDATNRFALLCAKDIGRHKTIANKAVRVITYKDAAGQRGIDDKTGQIGYMIAFPKILSYIMGKLSGSEYFEHGIRKIKYHHPEIAIREFLANALIHQDFLGIGYGPRVEIFPDKVKITNLGKPLVDTNFFIQGPARSRNERLASAMYKGGLCEQRGSGVDRACIAIEAAAQAAPLFEVINDSTVVTLFRTDNFNAMSKDDRIRACYQHACLLKIRNEPITNSTLRKRLGLTERQAASATGVINDAIEAGLIKPVDSDQAKKSARYFPYWA